MLQGFIGYGLSLYWMFYIFRWVAIPLYAIMALFTALFCLLYNFLSKRIDSALLKVAAAAVLWTAFEFFRSEIFFLRFPWITPGTAIGPTWMSPIVGVYGTSFLMMATAAAFVFRKTIWLGAVLAAGVICLGVFRPGAVAPPAGDDGLIAAVVQSESCDLATYKELTQSIVSESPDLVVWPEYSLPYDVRQHIYTFAGLTNFCADVGAVFVLGTQTKTGTSISEWYNTALIMDKDRVVGEYYKARPVHMFNDGIAGKDFNPIKTVAGKLATPICFDCDYSAVSRKMTRLGAEYFAVPSFDNANWSETQHLQHSMFFRLRAAENSRWLACAASSGVSQIIDPHGNVHQSIPAMESGVITGRIGRNSNLNLYVRVGWLFPWITILLSLIIMLRLNKER
jgi:apolipoprotein N-acyltransferase